MLPKMMITMTFDPVSGHSMQPRDSVVLLLTKSHTINCSTITMKLAFALVIFLALLPTADALFLDAILTLLCWLTGGLLFGGYCGTDIGNESPPGPVAQTPSPVSAPTPSPFATTPSPIAEGSTRAPTEAPTPSPVSAPAPSPVATTPSPLAKDSTRAPTAAPTSAPVSTDPAPDALKIKEDSFGVAAKFKEILNPYIPVEMVSEGADFNLAFDLKQGTGTSVNLPGSTNAFCEPGGYTIGADIDQTNQASYDNAVRNFLQYVMEDWGISKQEACDAGYFYSNLPKISCCTAPQLSALDKCFKGRQEANPTCWSPPDTTPQPGQAIAKVKVLVASALVAEGWTEADTLKKIERSNRLVASSEGLTAQLRFTLFAQQTVNAADFGTNADETTLSNTKNFGSDDADKSKYDVIMYLFKEKPATGSVVGKAGGGLCSGDPTAVVANVYASLVVPHELMHTLGAVHDNSCTDYIIDIDLGMGACNVQIMQSKIPTFTCLAVAE